MDAVLNYDKDLLRETAEILPHLRVVKSFNGFATSDNGKITLECSVEPSLVTETENQWSCNFRLTDNGMPIPSRKAKKSRWWSKSPAIASPTLREYVSSRAVVDARDFLNPNEYTISDTIKAIALEALTVVELSEHLAPIVNEFFLLRYEYDKFMENSVNYSKTDLTQVVTVDMMVNAWVDRVDRLVLEGLAEDISEDSAMVEFFRDELELFRSAIGTAKKYVELSSEARLSVLVADWREESNALQGRSHGVLTMKEGAQ